MIKQTKKTREKLVEDYRLYQLSGINRQAEKTILESETFFDFNLKVDKKELICLNYELRFRRKKISKKKK